MSDAKGQQHEPSMEEILASIRRIIAEDGDTSAPPAAAAPAPVAAAPAPAPPPAAPAPAPPPAPVAVAVAPVVVAPVAPAPPPQEDILELTEVVEPDGSVVSLNGAPIAAPVAAPTRVLVPVEDPEEDSKPAVAEERIVSPAVAAASVASLSQIASFSPPRQARGRDVPVGAGHLTLEMLVREELRPILKDWLDQYLPEMVERIVKEEIAALVRDVQKR